VISDNATTLATHGGGGGYSYGSFNLSGNAQILHNTSPFGGGIYLLYGAFTMSDNALIANNYSTSGNGGGLYLDAANGVTATINGGSFINNTAAMNGGAIWLSRTITPSGTTTPVNILNRLKVAAGVYFSQNQAIYAYELAPEDVAIYQAQIGNNGQDVTWTIPFTQGYNNFDIGYVYGTRIQYYTVSFDGNGGTVLPADLSRYVRSGDSLGANLPAAPLRDHQHFVGWNSAADGSGSEFTEATMVQSNLLVYAQWQENLYHVTVLDSYAVASGSGDYHFADTVSIQAGQCAGYNFAGWTVWSSNVSLSDSSVELADFVMPDADVVVQALWRAIPTYTVQFVDHDDTILSVQQVESDGSAVAPVSPSRAGYQFSGWDSDFSHVQSDLTVRAEYLKLPGEEPQVPSDPPVNPPRNPRIIPTITARPPATNPAPTTPAQTEVAAESTPTAAASSTNTAASTAVATPEREAMPTWALVNLLLAALGLLLALITILIKVLRRQTGSDQEATPLTTVEPMPAAAAEQNIQLETNPLVRSVESLTTPAAEQARRPKSRIAPLLLLVASAICGIGVFLWTENLNNPMAWVDVWTIVQAILALAVVVLMVATLRKGKTEEDSEETED
ncbi:MAG: InlB B-repeat-containing protein, partial [Actinomycetia bacterium]|nr:InlB B-repeat-containing protein [Actinomycetes bacterium]